MKKMQRESDNTGKKEMEKLKQEIFNHFPAIEDSSPLNHVTEIPETKFSGDALKKRMDASCALNIY